MLCCRSEIKLDSFKVIYRVIRYVVYSNAGNVFTVFEMKIDFNFLFNISEMHT